MPATYVAMSPEEERAAVEAVAVLDARLGLYDVLLVYRVDRFARSLKVLVHLLEELDRAGVAFRWRLNPSTPPARPAGCSCSSLACSPSSSGPPSSIGWSLA